MRKIKIDTIPFHPQIWNLNNWQELGFKSVEDALYWQNSSCGILCLKMAAEGLLGQKIDAISRIIEKGNEIKAYTHDTGWSHNGLVALAKQYGVDAYSSHSLNENNLKKLLDDGSLVIMSIKWAFEVNKTLRDRIIFWKKRGGHLALVTGYAEGGFIVNHTSTSHGYNWEHKIIPFNKFKKGSTGRGIVLGAR